jgi:hypothetical protein
VRLDVPKTYKAYREWLLLFAEHLRQELPTSASDAIFKYIDCADRFDGTPQPNNPEWFDAPCRGGFLNDIPGVVSEALLCIHLARIYGKRAIYLPQDKHTQSVEKVDVVVSPLDPPRGNMDKTPTHLYPAISETFQSKTVRFVGTRLLIDPTWVEGTARWVALTDIDDRETYVVDRKGLIPYSGKTINARDLQPLTVYHFNHRQLMKGM